MLPEEFEQLLDNPAFISDIYNYCDGWCERCPLTDRCAQFARREQSERQRANRRLSGKPPIASPADDLESDEFFDELSEIMQASATLLKEMMIEDGLDPEAILAADDSEFLEQQRVNDEIVDNHPLTVLSRTYIDQVEAWFATADGLFQEKNETMQALVRMNIGEAQVEEEALQIIDTVEVIRWYQTLIYIKVATTLSWLLKEGYAIEQSVTFPFAMDASIKVALITIDRSITAWTRLVRTFRQRETETLEILVRLDRLRRALEQTFPNARAIVRPGLDTISPLEE